MSRPARRRPPPALGKGSIVLGLKAGRLEDAVDELVLRALHGAGRVFQRRDEIARDVKEGLKGKVLELQRGSAVLRLRLADIDHPRTALGVSRDGLTLDAAGDARVFVVLLQLLPESRSANGLAGALRRLGDDKTIHLLRTAQSVEDVLAALAEPQGKDV
mgnify:CR=1 FL=1